MTPSGERLRLDALLAERGLFPSRSRAAASVIAGEVLIGADRLKAVKPGQMVARDSVISLLEPEHSYVSRGGVKLANALDGLRVDVRGRSAMDAGASTGGFTDCMLQRGAERVFAVDVGYGELAWSLRNDSRVVVRERTNVRSLSAADLPWPVDLIVCDVSFIAVAKVLPALLDCVSEGGEVLAMVKPQFEVGKELVGKGGVVRDASVRRKALIDVGRAAEALGASVIGMASSGLPGPKGNIETFVHIVRERGASQQDTLEAMALTVDP